MSHECRVRDVMSEAVMFVKAGEHAADAAAALSRHRVNGAPVLGRGGRVVGIVSKTDLTDPRRVFDGALVEAVMTRVVYAVRADDPVMQAVRLMVRQDIHRAMVVNDDGSVAGIVAPMDILRSLEQGRWSGTCEEEEADFVDLRLTDPS